jgi:hypothetical protein
VKRPPKNRAWAVPSTRSIGLVAVALWSIVGIAVAIRLDNPDAAWKFLLGWSAPAPR